jgi:uncharacterized protein
MQPNEETLNEIVRKILGVARPDRIILFGSAAEGTMTPDSDLDLLVVGEGLGDEREGYIRLRSALIGIDTPVDIFAMTPERFEETKNVFGGLAYPAHKYGRVIYEAA